MPLFGTEKVGPNRAGQTSFELLTLVFPAERVFLNRLPKLLFSFLILGAGMSSSALGYYAVGPAWPGSPVVIKYSYVNMFDGGIRMPDGSPMPNSLIRGSIEEALRVWTTAAPIHFVEVPDDGFDGFDRFRFSHMYINGPDPAPPADPIAKANVPFLGYGFGNGVRFDDSDRWQEVGTQSQPDILGAAIHEVGHILGLAHTDVVGSNMYWIFHRFSGLGTGQLFPDDIAGIQALYGAGVGSVTTLGVPEPSSVALVVLAFGSWILRRRVR